MISASVRLQKADLAVCWHLSVIFQGGKSQEDAKESASRQEIFQEEEAVADYSTIILVHLGTFITL